MNRKILIVWALVATVSLCPFLLFVCGTAYAGSLGDHDGDGVPDSLDNCVVIYNPNQASVCTYGSGHGDVHVSFNGGLDRLYIGHDNIMEIWIANGNPLRGMSIGFAFTSASGPFTWVTPYGNHPDWGPYYVQDHGDVHGAFDLSSLQFNVIALPDSFLMGGSALTTPLPRHTSPLLCYSLKLRIPAEQSPSISGFCVDNHLFNSSGTWRFDAGAPVGAWAPDFQENPNTSYQIPDAPPVCFDIVLPISGDADGSQSVDISDAVYLIQYIFAEGLAPYLVELGDANCDSAIDISDVVYLIAYIFAGGPAPC